MSVVGQLQTWRSISISEANYGLPMRTFLLALLLTTTPSIAADDWAEGSWELMHDEDGSPKEYLTLKAGKAQGYFANCEPHGPYRYHLNGGDMYLTFEWPKGPVAQVYRASADRQGMKFTSSRTNGTATWRRLDTNPCPLHEGII